MGAACLRDWWRISRARLSHSLSRFRNNLHFYSRDRSKITRVSNALKSFARLELQMPIAAFLFALDVVLIIHAARTGRFWPWAYVILLLPGIGSFAYFLFELVPEWMGSVQGQKARRTVVKTLNPEKRYRELTDQLALTDTIANRAALAEECLLLGKFEEAAAHYEAVLARPLGDDPVYAVGKARALFGLQRPDDVVVTLEDLRRRWPNYQSADAHLLYARALEDSGRSSEALEEYEALSQYYPGAEARVRYGLLLAVLGHRGEARSVFAEVLKQAKRAPKYVRKAQAEWIAIAERELRV